MEVACHRGSKGIDYELARNLVQAGLFVLLAAHNQILRLEAVERLKHQGAEAISFIEVRSMKQEMVAATAKKIAAASGVPTERAIGR